MVCILFYCFIIWSLYTWSENKRERTNELPLRCDNLLQRRLSLAQRAVLRIGVPCPAARNWFWLCSFWTLESVDPGGKNRERAVL